MRYPLVLIAGAVFALAACSSPSNRLPAPSPNPQTTPLAGIYAANVSDMHGLGPGHVRVSMYEANGKMTGVFIVHERIGGKFGQHIFVNRIDVSNIAHTPGETTFSGTVDLGGKLGTMHFNGTEAAHAVSLYYQDASGTGSFRLPLVGGYSPVYATTQSLLAATGRKPMDDDGGPPPVTAPGTYTVSTSGLPVWTSATVAAASSSYNASVQTIQAPCSLPSPTFPTQFTVTLSNPQPITNVGPWPFFPQYTYTASMVGPWQYGIGQPWNVPNSSSYLEPQDYDGDFMMTAEVQVPWAIAQPSYTSNYNGWEYTFAPVTNELTDYYVNIQIDTDQGGITGQVQTIPGIDLYGTPSIEIGLLSTSSFAGNSPTVTGVCDTTGNITVTGPQ